MLDMNDRYGRKRTPMRFIPIVIFIALIGWLYWSASHHSNPTITANLVSFEAVNEKAMGIDFEITRRDPNAIFTCRLTATDFEKFIVGEIQYKVNAGEKHLRIHAVIPTRAKAVSAAVTRCSLVN
jgi:Domain of unknown function (DUF4307)